MKDERERDEGEKPTGGRELPEKRPESLRAAGEEAETVASCRIESSSPSRVASLLCSVMTDDMKC